MTDQPRSDPRRRCSSRSSSQPSNVSGRGRRGVALSALTVAEAKPRRQRKPITDPEQLKRRRAALAKARAARAEKLAAGRVGGGAAGGEGRLRRVGRGGPLFIPGAGPASRPGRQGSAIRARRAAP